MQVAVLFGRSSNIIVENVKKKSDSVDYHVYGSFKELIKSSNLRQIYFDRIVFSEGILKKGIEKELNLLNDYIVEKSDSTKVVMLAKNTETEQCRVFTEIFNSPLYTVILTGEMSPTIPLILEACTKDVLELKTKYFTMNGGKVGGSDSASTENSELRGQNTKHSQVGENMPNNGLKRKSNLGSLNRSGTPQTVSNMEQNGESKNSEMDSIFGFSDSAGSGDGTESQSHDFYQNDEEDDFLGLAEFGKDHSDTGFFDEEEEENSDAKNQSEQVTRESVNTSVNRTDSVDLKGLNRVVLVTGERGVGVTSFVVDIVGMLYERKESVLVVDADYKRNGILSFIDSKEFYEKGYVDGIDTLNPYIDEEADVVSNGYGTIVQKSSITKLLNSRDLRSKYDRIIIDCPCDCLNTISGRTINGCSVIIVAKSELVSLMATSIGLTDKALVEPALERYIMENCSVVVTSDSEEFEENIAFVRETFMFPNGCWLDNIR